MTHANMKLPDKSKMGAEIKALSEQKNVKPVELAYALGKTVTTVYKLYQGSASYKLLELAINTLDGWDK